MSLDDFYREFPKREDCIMFLEYLRWNKNPTCPYCESNRFTKSKGDSRYHCNNCNSSYSVTVDTLFHRTRVDLQKWFFAISIVMRPTDKISSRELSKKIKTTKDTAWRMIQEIKNAVINQDSLIKKIIEYERA